MFDHTFLVAQDDPMLETFQSMEQVWQVRVLPAIGAEQFAKFIYEKFTEFIKVETDGRVKIASVEFIEHAKNSAIYSEST